MLEKKRFIEIGAKVMADETILPVHIQIREAWLLVSGLQAVTRHPELSKSMKDQLESIARQFQQSIVDLHPEAEELLNMGWQHKYDVPRKFNKNRPDRDIQ